MPRYFEAFDISLLLKNTYPFSLQHVPQPLHENPNIIFFFLLYTKNININYKKRGIFMRGLFFNPSLLNHTKSKWAFWIWMSNLLHHTN